MNKSVYLGLYSHVNLTYFLHNEIYIGVLGQLKDKLGRAVKCFK